MKVAKNSSEAFAIGEKYEGLPHGWIQWKGTNVCLDFHCECGAHLHFDCDFLYHVKCGNCKSVFALNGHVEAIKLIEEPNNAHEDFDEELANDPTTKTREEK